MGRDRSRRRLRILLAALTLLTVAGAHGEVFKYTDRLGNIYFTDRPMKGDYRLESRFSYPTRSRARVNTAAMRMNRARFTPLIETAARERNLQAELLHAVITVESAYDPKALSRVGARGLMQLMPDTARRYGVQDSWDPKQNIEGGARYLRDLLSMFEEDLQLALAAYNAGENAVKQYGNRIPPYPETRDYVAKVMALYDAGRQAEDLTASR
jgi:soluble lytic murein transglycosylase-like protein